jgi:hypothetical protein
MFSVSRLFISSKYGLKKSLNLSSFFKNKVNFFGAKSKDGDVDKSKKSVSGGSTTSDTEKREPTQQTIKVQASTNVNNTTNNKKVEPVQAAPQKETPKASPTQTTTSNTTQTKPSVKIVETVPGHKVSFF